MSRADPLGFAAGRRPGQLVASVGIKISALIIFSIAGLTVCPAQEYRQLGPDIFDPQAAGAGLVSHALAQAGSDHRRVLLLFGANWCPWTRRLHRALSTDAAVLQVLRGHFVLAYVDANTRKDKRRNAAVIAQYGNPLRFGIPVFVVLEWDGAILATQETQSLAAKTDEEVADRVRGFLAKWVP